MKKIKSVMLIDDNEIDIFINQKTIESLNFVERIQTFSCAKDALNYLKLIEEKNAYYQLLISAGDTLLHHLLYYTTIPQYPFVFCLERRLFLLLSLFLS